MYSSRNVNVKENTLYLEQVNEVTKVLSYSHVKTISVLYKIDEMFIAGQCSVEHVFWDLHWCAS